MLRLLFEAISTTPQEFVNAQRGEEFEDRIDHFLRNAMNYSRLRNTDIHGWSALRAEALRKSDDSPIENTYDVSSSYIYQPNGGQNYPDFMVFEMQEVVCIEVKFSKQPKPVWNSGLPRPNGFYILGMSRRGDATFFRGSDVISVEESEAMHTSFDMAHIEEEGFNDQRMCTQKYGFSVYVRKAFDQSKKYNSNAIINYYDSPDRPRLEQNVLDYFE